MFRILLPLVLLAAPALAVTPGKVPAPADTAPATPEAMLPFIYLGFARSDCVLPLSTGQQTLAEAMASMLHTTPEALRDNAGPWNSAIDRAFDQLRDSGRAVIDHTAGTITIPDCR